MDLETVVRPREFERREEEENNWSSLKALKNLCHLAAQE